MLHSAWRSHSYFGWPDEKGRSIRCIIVDDFTREYNAKANQSEALKVKLKADLQRTKSEIQKLIEAIKAGVPGDALKDEMQSLQDRQKKI